MLAFDLAFYSSPKLRPATASLWRGSLSLDKGGGKRRGGCGTYNVTGVTASAVTQNYGLVTGEADHANKLR
jgi:hypothetical protein